MNALRVGLIGIGDAGGLHARALAALHAEGLLRWTAVCARDRRRVEGACARWSSPALPLTDLGAVFERCDAVILATPDGLHADQVVACAEAGLHVLVEKPLALTAADGERALTAIARHDRVLAVGYHLRHHAGHQLVRERLDALCGPLRNIAVRWCWPDPATAGWRARGDAARFWSLAALGTHGIDLALWLAEAAVPECRGPSWDDLAAITLPPDGIDRAAEVSLRLGSVMAHVSVAITHRALSRLDIVGERGEVACLGTLGARGAGEIWHREVGQAERRVAFEAADPYARQLRAFVARIEAGATGGPEHALANLEILDRIAIR